MSDTTNDPRCPECNGKITQTAIYCMHCSADLPDHWGANVDANGIRDQPGDTKTNSSSVGERKTPELLDSDGPKNNTLAVLVGIRGLFNHLQDGSERQSDNTPTISVGIRGLFTHLLAGSESRSYNILAVLVGIVGGVVIGMAGTTILLIVTESAWAIVFGFFAWVGTTTTIARCRTVQGAVAKSGYAIAVVLLLVPMISFGPSVTVNGGTGGRLSLFVMLLLFSAVPASVAVSVGWMVSRFIPDNSSKIEN